MNRWRHGVALTIVAALAVVTLLALRPPVPAVEALAPTTTTPADPVTTAAPVTTVATVATTTTTVAVDREVEAGRIVHDFYYRWFSAIHRRDLSVVDPVAGTEAVLEMAEKAFDTVQLLAAPTAEAIVVDVRRILLDRPDCLVVSADVDYRQILAVDDPIHFVGVFFRVGDGWGLAVRYQYEREMWLSVCDHMQRR